MTSENCRLSADSTAKKGFWPLRFVWLCLAGIGVLAACSESKILDPSEFTRTFAVALQRAGPELNVVVIRDLELKVITSDGREMRTFLDNAYDMYKQDPRSKEDTIQKYVTSGLETYNRVQTDVDRTKIVPIIKDRPWLEEMRTELLKSGVKEVAENVFEDLNRDLVIVYAEDTPKNIRYLSPEDLKTAKLERSEIKELACENLKRILPEMELIGGNGVFAVTAGGDFDASLLLFDSIWDPEHIEVKGEFVVAIPARDMLLVTGSEDQQGLEKMKNLVEETTRVGTYRLTKKLFVRREGTFVEFTGLPEK